MIKAKYDVKLTKFSVNNFEKGLEYAYKNKSISILDTLSLELIVYSSDTIAVTPLDDSYVLPKPSDNQTFDEYKSQVIIHLLYAIGTFRKMNDENKLTIEILKQEKLWEKGNE